MFNYIPCFLFFSSCKELISSHKGSSYLEIMLYDRHIRMHSYLIPRYVHMKAGVTSAGQRCKQSDACVERFAGLPLFTWTWFSRQISPRGWLNTIAFPSSKSRVCVAKHATRQWKLAVWMMVITLATEAANASFPGRSRMVSILNERSGAGIHTFTLGVIKLQCWRGLFT